MERCVVVAVHRTTIAPLGSKQIAFTAGGRGTIESMPGKRIGLRIHKGTPSRVTVSTKSVVRQTGSVKDPAVTTRGEM